MIKSTVKSKSYIKVKRKCVVCGRPVFSSKSNHCYICHHVARCMNDRGFHKEAIEQIWDYVRRYGYVCYYTGFPLEMKDYSSPFYFVFDHMIPGDDRKIVITFALLNEMKSDMTPKEFRYYILQFAKFFTTGAKIRKMRLKYWVRLAPKIGK